MPDQPKSVAAVVLKILLDRLLFTPVNMAALFIITGVVEGQSLHKIVLTARSRYVQAPLKYSFRVALTAN